MLKRVIIWAKNCWFYLHQKFSKKKHYSGLTLHEELGLVEEIPYGQCTTLKSNPLSLFHLVETYIQYDELWKILQEEYPSGDINPMTELRTIHTRSVIRNDQAKNMMAFMIKMSTLGRVLDGIARGLK